MRNNVQEKIIIFKGNKGGWSTVPLGPLCPSFPYNEFTFLVNEIAQLFYNIVKNIGETFILCTEADKNRSQSG